MKIENKFTPIDMETWPNAGTFMAFTQMDLRGFALTVNIDITHMLEAMKDSGYKFWPTWVWLVTRNLNKQQDFRVGVEDGVVGYYETLNPLSPILHDDTMTITMFTEDYYDSLKEFHEAYMNHVKEFEKIPSGFANQPPHSYFTIASLPWFSFTHFHTRHELQKDHFAPLIETGKFFEENGKKMMPLSMTCHHATLDWYNIKIFLEDLQADMENLEKLL